MLWELLYYYTQDSYSETAKEDSVSGYLSKILHFKTAIK